MIHKTMQNTQVSIFKENKISGTPTGENLSIDVSFTTVGLILMKLGLF